MSAATQRSSSTKASSSILIVEEYDALALAIVSALKKFAPNHVTSIAASIDEAKSVATESNPQLFIIDYASSYTDLLSFLQTIRKDHPGSRALVLAVDVPPEIAAERGAFGALQLLQKPFELAQFGTLVQRLLDDQSATGPSRTLRDLDLHDVVAIQCAGRRSVILDVRGSGGNSGAINIVDGQILHAESDGRSGVEALKEMFQWPNPRIEETAKRQPEPRTIRGRWGAIFLAARALSPASQETPKVSAPPKTGKKIVIVDDTETLLLFAEDAISRADPEAQITTALDGASALKQIERVHPDLVLLDYQLPDFNGDEICRRLLKHEQTARIPVVMMSGHIAEMTATAAHFENIVATIEKPFFSEALIELVQRTLAKGPKPAITTKPMSKEEAPAVAKMAPPPIQPAISRPALEPMPEEVKSSAAIPSPLSRPVVSSARTEPVQSTTPAAPRVAAVPFGGKSEVVFGLFLEVLSMQLTPELRMGAIRARPVSSIVALHFPSGTPHIPSETGFKLASTHLDAKGRISTMRLLPTATPFQPAQTRRTFEIGGVAMIPNEARARVQLTPAGTTPMTMELIAHLEMGGVRLSPTFQLSELILNWHSDVVHITLNPKAPEQSGADFKITEVAVDENGRIAELLLNPVR